MSVWTTRLEKYHTPPFPTNQDGGDDKNKQIQLMHFDLILFMLIIQLKLEHVAVHKHTPCFDTL